MTGESGTSLADGSIEGDAGCEADAEAEAMTTDGEAEDSAASVVEDEHPERARPPAMHMAIVAVRKDFMPCMLPDP